MQLLLGIIPIAIVVTAIRGARAIARRRRGPQIAALLGASTSIAIGLGPGAGGVIAAASLAWIAGQADT